MALFGSQEELSDRDINETLLLISRLSVRDNRITSGIRRALIKKGERALPGLIRSLNSPNSMVREICVDLLGEAGFPQAVAPLLDRLYDYRENIPPKAEKALRKIVEKHLTTYESAKNITDELQNERKQVVEPLAQALANPSELMRMGEVVRLLVDLKNEATRALLKTYSVADRKSTRLNSSHIPLSRMPSSA